MRHTEGHLLSSSWRSRCTSNCRLTALACADRHYVRGHAPWTGCRHGPVMCVCRVCLCRSRTLRRTGLRPGRFCAMSRNSTRRRGSCPRAPRRVANSSCCIRRTVLRGRFSTRTARAAPMPVSWEGTGIALRARAPPRWSGARGTADGRGRGRTKQNGSSLRRSCDSCAVLVHIECVDAMPLPRARPLLNFLSCTGNLALSRPCSLRARRELHCTCCRFFRLRRCASPDATGRRPALALLRRAAQDGGGIRAHIIIPLVVLPVLAVLSVAACSVWLWRRAARDKVRLLAVRPAFISRTQARRQSAQMSAGTSASGESRRPLRRAPRPLSGEAPSRPLSLTIDTDVKLSLPPPPPAHTRARSRDYDDDEALALDLGRTFGEAPARRDSARKAPRRVSPPKP